MNIRSASVQQAALATPDRSLARFVRFASSSLMCTAVDQLVAWSLFSMLRDVMFDADFTRILIASVVARAISLSMNYRINNRLVFATGEGAPMVGHSAVRYLVVSMSVLALSCLGVFWAHTVLCAPEWQAKIIVDVCLFFVNYNAQRTWVFKGQQA